MLGEFIVSKWIHAIRNLFSGWISFELCILSWGSEIGEINFKTFDLNEGTHWKLRIAIPDISMSLYRKDLIFWVKKKLSSSS